MPTMTTSSVNVRSATQAAATTPAQRSSDGSVARNQRSERETIRQVNSIQLQVKTLTNFSIDSIIGQEGNKQTSSPTREEKQPTSVEAALQTLELISLAEISNDLTRQRTKSKPNQIPAINELQPPQEIKKYRPKNFQCPACCMAFSNNGQLKNHVRIHTGERPFRCNHFNCGKTFTRNEELTRHKLIHTGARPHACPSCSKRFGRKDHLKKHVKTHERKKLRKSCYAPPQPPSEIISGSAKREFNTYALADQSASMLFSPKKQQINNEKQPTSSFRLDASSMSNIMPIPTQKLPGAQYDQYSGGMALLAPPQPPQPPVTFAPPTQFINQSTARTMAAIASSNSLNMLSSTTSGPLQQFGDYWQKWYNFLGFYQHP